MLRPVMSILALSMVTQGWSFMAYADGEMCPGTDKPVVVEGADPNIKTDCSHLECRGMQQQKFKIDGQMVSRYVISDTSQMNCLKVRPRAPWKVTKTQWDAQDETDWQSFVHGMGLAVERKQCGTVDSCMISTANIFRDDIDMNSLHYSDCAKFPEYMRQYFSYKKNLPFSFVSRVRPSYSGDEQEDATGQSKDIRYTSLGNFPTKRFNYAGGNGDYNDMAESLLWEVATKTYRMYSDPQTEYANILPGSEFFPAVPQYDDQQKLISPATPQADNLMLAATGQIAWEQPDFYSPKIDAESVKVGSVVYDATGHVALVYDIREGGQLMLLAAHPGNGLDVKAFDGTQVIRSRPMHGAGFKNWRPFVLQNPQQGRGRHVGEIVGGDFAFTPDSAIPDVSYVQYFGYGWQPGAWDQVKSVMAPADRRGNEKASMEWDRYVKMQISSGHYKEDPVYELRQSLGGICQVLQDRADYVNTAMQPHDNGPVFQQPHPAKLPRNIYGADGDWESFSSPGSDFARRHNVLNLIAKLQIYRSEVQSGKPSFVYHGADLQADLLKAFNELDKSCQITYVNSQNQPVVIGSLQEAIARFPLMSFDPYDCPELRWGASSPSELATCSNTADKNQWYKAEQFLRNQAQYADTKDDNAVMGWDLVGLQQAANGQDNSARANRYDIYSAIKAIPAGFSGTGAATSSQSSVMQVATPAPVTPVAFPVLKPTPVQAITPAAKAPVVEPPAPVLKPTPVLATPVATPVAKPVVAPTPAPVVKPIAVKPPVVVAPTPAPQRPVPQPAPSPVVRPTPAPPAPVAVKCMSGFCVGQRVADPDLGDIQGQVVDIRPDLGYLLIRWDYNSQLIYAPPSRVQKL